MKKLFVFYFLFCINGLVFSQINSDYVAGSITQKDAQEKLDSIQIMNGSKGWTYCRNGIALNYRDMKGVLSKNNKAYDEFVISKNNNSTSTLFAIGGSCILFYGIVSYLIYDNKWRSGSVGVYEPAFNPSPLFIGLGAIAVSIPFGIASKVHLRKAVETYNGSSNFQTSQSLKLNLGVTSNGLGLRMIF